MLNLQDIRNTLAGYRHQVVTPGARTRQAAVAIIVRETDQGDEILFIKRAEKEGDPWSGHMAFPGGHLDPTDPSLEHAARRETMEEIALDLSHSRYLGALDHEHATPRARMQDMLIAPHAFEVSGSPSFAPNYEVDDVVWAPLTPLVHNQWHDTETYTVGGEDILFNGYRLPEGYFVWGLTYRILKTFFMTVKPDWQAVDIE